MIRFGDLRIRHKLAVVVLAVILPLILGGILTLWYFTEALRQVSELELTNTVEHLYRLTQLNFEKALGNVDPRGSEAGVQLKPSDRRFLAEVFSSIHLGKTGYPYVMNTKGDLLIHPTKAGQNIADSHDSDGKAFIKEICRRAKFLRPEEVGTVRYPWQNLEEGELEPRLKLVKFKYFRTWDWIIAAGAYEEEIYTAVVPVQWYSLVIVVASLALASGLVLAMHRLIARPVIAIAKAAERLAEGDLGQRVDVGNRRDELSVLGRSFNSMADQVRRHTENLERLVKERTSELIESRETYRSLVENTVDGIVTTDQKGTITFANAGFEVMLGLKRSQILGRKIYEFYSGGIEEARLIMRKLRREGNFTGFAQVMLTSQGAIPIMTSASLLRDSEGREMGTLGIFADVTVMKKLEEDLKQAQVHLAQTNKLRALGDLVAGVAHEVNNPLMASTTMLHVLEKNLPSEDEKLRSRIEVLKKCNERITKIVNHLREFSRQTMLELKWVDINLPVENALLISTQQLLNMQVDIRRNFQRDLPKIRGDANYLEQVFLDLIANARDALEGSAGERILEVSTRAAELEGQPAVAVSIRDNGPGIPKDILDKIFEPFFTTKPVGKGTGLGLPICYGIVQEHGGTIAVNTEAGRGAEFLIRIPAAQESNADASKGT